MKCCEKMERAVKAGDVEIYGPADARTFHINGKVVIYLDDGDATDRIEIDYCPFCGAALKKQPCMTI